MIYTVFRNRGQAASCLIFLIMLICLYSKLQSSVLTLQLSREAHFVPWNEKFLKDRLFPLLTCESSSILCTIWAEKWSWKDPWSSDMPAGLSGSWTCHFILHWELAVQSRRRQPRRKYLVARNGLFQDRLGASWSILIFLYFLRDVFVTEKKSYEKWLCYLCVCYSSIAQAAPSVPPNNFDLNAQDKLTMFSVSVSCRFCSRFWARKYQFLHLFPEVINHIQSVSVLLGNLILNLPYISHQIFTTKHCINIKLPNSLKVCLNIKVIPNVKQGKFLVENYLQGSN